MFNPLHRRNKMRRYLIFAYSLSILFMTGNSLIFAKEQPDKLHVPTGDMVLTAPSHSQTTMSPVAFPHSLHFGFSCKSCHHEWDQVSPVEGCASSGCHEKLWASPPGTTPLDQKRIKSLTGAYHNVCRECHRSQLKEQNATGPVTCGECHPADQVAVKKSLESLEIPLGTLTLTAPEGSESKRPPVEFPHGGHFNYSCQTCHHEWDGESPVQNCTVSGCHDQLEADEKTRDINAPENSLYFLAAYHKACIQCHRDLGKQRARLEKSGITETLLPKYGPVVCGECHSDN
jgi:class III cytochrome C family protein